MAGMEQKQELSMEEQLEQVQRNISNIQNDIKNIQSTQGILVNYIQLLIEERGLKEKAAHLEKKIEAMRDHSL